MITLTRSTRALLLQGEPCDAAVNFDRYRILQWHRVVSLPQHGFLVQAYISDRSNAEITQSVLIFTTVKQNHGDSQKSRHTTGKSHDDRYCQ